MTIGAISWILSPQMIYSSTAIVWNHSFFVAYPQFPPHRKKTKGKCGTRKPYVSIKNLSRNGHLLKSRWSETIAVKYLRTSVVQQKTLKTKIYWPCNNPWVNCWCFWPILPVWLRKQTPLASDMDQSPFQKCSEKNLRSGKGISSLFQGSKNSGFPFCNCYPCVATWNPPLCPARFFAHGRHWMKQTSFFHVFPRGHSNTNTAEYICPQCTQCKYINKYI